MTFQTWCNYFACKRTRVFKEKWMCVFFPCAYLYAYLHLCGSHLFIFAWVRSYSICIIEYNTFTLCASMPVRLRLFVCFCTVRVCCVSTRVCISLCVSHILGGVRTENSNSQYEMTTASYSSYRLH